jgi:hypothetical protein
MIIRGISLIECLEILEQISPKTESSRNLERAARNLLKAAVVER